MVGERGDSTVQQGSTISILVHTVLPEEPPQNLSYLWNEITNTYEELGISGDKRFGSLRMNMFSKEVCAPRLASWMKVYVKMLSV